MHPCPGKPDTQKLSIIGWRLGGETSRKERKIRNVGQKALSTGCFSSQLSLYRGIWKLYATVPPNIDTNTSWVVWRVGSFLIQAAMTQSKEFIQTTFLAQNWAHGEKGVRSRPHFSGGSADGELVRELSRESDPLGTSHSPAADLLHYSFHNLCSNFLLLLFKKHKKTSSFPLKSLISELCLVLCLNSSVISIPVHPECCIPGMGNICKMPGVPGIPKGYYEYSAKPDH